MTLGKLIQILKDLPPDKKVRMGFTLPQSYRGFYDNLAFEPVRDVLVEDMLKDANGAVGYVFTGYKGREYKMGLETPCWLARYGNTGIQLTWKVITYLLLDEGDGEMNEIEEAYFEEIYYGS